MKTHKIYKIMLMALMLFTTSLFITGVDAEAKAYKAKTVKVTSGKTKTVKTKKKIKKVKIVSKNKNFSVKKTGNYKFKVSGTDKGKSQTVKVTYTNKYTQKFKIKTVKAKKKTTKKIPSYAQKIVNELKPLLADPDKGLQTVLNQWEKRLGYECDFKLINTPITGNTTYLTLDEITTNYTVSQKKALIIEVYLRQRMTYGSSNDYKNRGTNAYYKKIYNGTFKGVCADGAEAGYDICQYLGIKSKCTGFNGANGHAWCAVYVTNKNGVSYWHGIYTTSYGYNLKGTASIPNNWTMTKKQVESYKYNPYETFFKASKKQVVNKPTRTPKPAPTTAPSVTTQTPVQTPAPTPKPSPTTTTVIFNTPEPPEPEETETPVATTEPTKAPVATQEPSPTTQAPIITPEPTVEPTPEPTPAPTETPVPQRIIIPHEEHNYTCAGCNPLNPPPVRHTDNSNPYITNSKTTYKNYVVYKHVIGTEVRWFDKNGNEYIDINKNGNIMDELIQLAG